MSNTWKCSKNKKFPMNKATFYALACALLYRLSMTAAALYNLCRSQPLFARPPSTKRVKQCNTINLPKRDILLTQSRGRALSTKLANNCGTMCTTAQQSRCSVQIKG